MCQFFPTTRTAHSLPSLPHPNHPSFTLQDPLTMLAFALFSLLSLPLFSFAAPIEPRARSKLPRLGGINLSGCEWGVGIEGSIGSPVCPPVSQVSHFTDQGANLIRLPVAWEYIISDSTDAGSESFNVDFFDTYNALVLAALDAGAYVIVDLHNYARWSDGTIIGQGGPPDSNFETIWRMLATAFSWSPNVIFGLMNEPHDLDMATWGTTCQNAVNAIRAAGATSQSILIPGDGYDTVSDWTSGDDNPMLAITDPSHPGDSSYLLIDMHHYLDSTGSGTANTCVDNGISSAWEPFVDFLRSNGRYGIVSETGGGNTASCETYLHEGIQYLSTTASDVVLGWSVWAGGSFDTSYALDLSPNSDGSDQPLWTTAMKPFLPGGTKT